MRFKTEIDYSF